MILWVLEVLGVLVAFYVFGAFKVSLLFWILLFLMIL